MFSINIKLFLFISESFEHRQQVNVYYTDFSKVFDTVHPCLFKNCPTMILPLKLLT